MTSFWESDVWGFVNLIAVLLAALLAANCIKKSVKFLRESLIPTSVLGGLLLLIISSVYKAATGNYIFDTEFFAGKGMTSLEVVTYHCLALGFIASALKPSSSKLSKKRTFEVFDTGVTTVSGYLLQAVLGLGITLLASTFLASLYPAAGLLLPFGFGQGTGQALNYGTIYEADGFTGGANFGLTIAALGFLAASLGGVVHLAILKKKGLVRPRAPEKSLSLGEVQSENEISMNGSVDKMTMQLAFIFVAYLLAYLTIWGLGELIPSFRSVLYGFNFLFGVLFAALVKFVLDRLHRRNLIKKKYINHFLMSRISGFFFDVMIIAGVAAIRIELLADYWAIILILAVVGTLATYFYNRIVAKKLFPDYTEEQFLVMYGMLTGTASTGMILLREIDPDYSTPAADNLVYQNFPAMVFGFPLMLLATFAMDQPLLTWGILIGFFLILNVILFRRFISRRKKKRE